MLNTNEILRLNLVLGPANKRELISHGVKLYSFSILSLICAAVLHEICIYHFLPKNLLFFSTIWQRTQHIRLDESNASL